MPVACSGATTLYARIWSETFHSSGRVCLADVLERLWPMLAMGNDLC
jgi:hypothetical protein